MLHLLHYSVLNHSAGNVSARCDSHSKDKNREVHREQLCFCGKMRGMIVKMQGEMRILDQYAVYVIDFVLDNLGGKACEYAGFLFEAFVFIGNLYGVIALGFSGTAQKGEAAFFRLVFTDFHGDFGIKHDYGAKTVIEYNDAFSDTDHIGGHTYAGVFMEKERVL